MCANLPTHVAAGGGLEENKGKSRAVGCRALEEAASARSQNGRELGSGWPNGTSLLPLSEGPGCGHICFLYFPVSLTANPY